MAAGHSDAQRPRAAYESRFESLPGGVKAFPPVIATECVDAEASGYLEERAYSHVHCFLCGCEFAGVKVRVGHR